MNISEIFYSLQGEGVTRGTPAIFIRLSGCNLTCGIQSKICDASKAEWICDSYKVWKTTTGVMTVKQVWDRILTFVTEEDINCKRVHLVWTGGEPTIPANIKEIEKFMKFVSKKDIHPFYEMETNGTNFNSKVRAVMDHIRVINCSPKLSNSGILKEVRINKDFLKYTKKDSSIYLKFVVTRKEHWAEIEEDFLPYISKEQIILMPGMDRLGEEALRVSQVVWDMAMEHRVLFSSREQITVWNRLTGI